MTAATWDDDRPGMMRVHVAAERARELCEAMTRDKLRQIAHARGVSTGARLKSELAFDLAFAGVKADDFGGLLLLMDDHPSPAHLDDSAKVKAAILHDGLEHDGEVDPNRVRKVLADVRLYHKNIGPAYHALRAARVIERDELIESDDKAGRNAGRMIWRYRLTERGRELASDLLEGSKQ